MPLLDCEQRLGLVTLSQERHFEFRPRQRPQWRTSRPVGRMRRSGMRVPAGFEAGVEPRIALRSFGLGASQRVITVLSQLGLRRLCRRSPALLGRGPLRGDRAFTRSEHL